ncbi:MAG: hypothetical protein J0M24_21250 [Verrucomicrobia bacterium]|nr:hypothetical protein [Verrucomicrobiota bacterium]
MRRWLLGSLLLLAGAGVSNVSTRGQDWFSAGPFATEFATIWETGERAEALGTLAMWEHAGDTTRWSLSPLLSYETTPVLERERFDLLYPLLTWRRSGTEYRWQLAQVFNFSGADRQSDDGVVRRALFPIYFQQTSRSGTNDYLAVLPFYGHLENRLFRDEITFYLFPVYVRTRKGEMTTRNYVYPFFHTRHGPGWSGWQFWPLYGVDHKEVRQITNHLGDPAISPGREKWFVLWPILFSDKKGLGTPQATTNFSVLPFYSSQHGRTFDQASYLWPLFSRTEDRAKQYVEWGAPWPLIGWANGAGKTARRVFPIYGDSKAGPVRSRFFLWPLFTHRQIDDETLRRDHWRSAFFLYDDVVLRSKETGDFRRERGVWPFFIWKRDLDGRERLQVLAPVETVLRNREAVQRNFSPLWALYRSEHNPNTGRSNQSVLWNLFRRDVSTNTVRTSCLFGLVQTERSGDERHWRWFWLPNRHFSAGKSGAATPPTPVPVAFRPPLAIKRGDVLAERAVQRTAASSGASWVAEK